MGYKKVNYADRVVQYPGRYTYTDDGTYLTVTRSPGTITEAGTDLNAANFNQMESGIDVASSYVTLTAATDGNYKVDMSNYYELETGDILTFNIPTATDNTDPAQISIDGGSNYKPVVTRANVALDAVSVESNVYRFQYNGTSWVLLDELKDVITANLQTNYTVLANDALETLTLTSYKSVGTRLSVSGGKVVIGAGIKTVKVSGLMNWSSIAVAAAKNAYIRQGTQARVYSTTYIAPGNVASQSLDPLIVDVTEGDTFDLSVYAKQNDVVQSSSNGRTYITVEVVE